MSKRSLECLRKIYYLHLKTYNNVKMKLHKKLLLLLNYILSIRDGSFLFVTEKSCLRWIKFSQFHLSLSCQI